MSKKAPVLFSGGQDSTTCLAWALSSFEHVETVGFDYQQRHRVELDCRVTILEALKKTFPNWGSRLGDDRVIDLGLIRNISETALTSDVEIEMQANGLPNTFVPGRDILFLTVAGALRREWD
jgi:7-cyano-7-deazaguanine synthase